MMAGQSGVRMVRMVIMMRVESVTSNRGKRVTAYPETQTKPGHLSRLVSEPVPCSRS